MPPPLIDRINHREDVGGAEQIQNYQYQDDGEHDTQYPLACGQLFGFLSQLLQFGIGEAVQSLTDLLLVYALFASA